MPKKSKGQKISLATLMGDRRNADDLPTGPSGMPDQGRYGDRYGGGGGRYGDRGGDRYSSGGSGGGGGRYGGGRDDTKWARGFDAGRDESGNERYASRDQGPSRSEEANQWRRGGSGGRFGGGGGGGDRYGGGGGRFGGGGGSDRYGGGGRGYGGNDRYGGGGGGYDDRPAHLRFGSRQQQPPREMPKKAEPKKEVKKDEKPVVHRVNQDLDDSLAGKTVVAVEERESVLQKKITNAEVVSMDDLINGLSKLAVDDKDTSAGFVDTMAKSLKAKTLPLEDAFRQIRSDVEGSFIPNLTTEIILSLKTKMESEAVFTDFIRNSKVDIFPTICGKELEGKELEAFLTEKDLLCIKPVPDLSEHVSKALANGESPDAILKHINSTVGETICVSNLGPAVLKIALEKVLATKDKADTAALDAFRPLLHRILNVPFDMAMQTECAFVAQVAWYEKGAVKKVMKELFPALHDKAIISAEAFMEWKEDTKKEKKSKMKTLLAISSWLEEIKPKEEYFDDEGDEGDEEEEDEYLQNPNLAF